VSEIWLSLVNLLGGVLPLSLPYHQTVRSWLLRCGLDLLRRSVPPRDDWVWILDHTIRIGQKKCLLILGASLDHLQDQTGALEHHQVVVLDLCVTSHSPGVDIENRLESLAQRVGMPRQIVSDHGSDVNKGVRLFQADYPEVIDTYDVTHKLACLVKTELEADPRGAEFLRFCTSSLFQIASFQPAAQAVVWQYGKAQDTVQSHSSDGHSALANFTATLTRKGSHFRFAFTAYSMTVLELVNDASRLDHRDKHRAVHVAHARGNRDNPGARRREVGHGEHHHHSAHVSEAV
jgi:hypothetical protein